MQHFSIMFLDESQLWHVDKLMWSERHYNLKRQYLGNIYSSAFIFCYGQNYEQKATEKHFFVSPSFICWV